MKYHTNPTLGNSRNCSPGSLAKFDLSNHQSRAVDAKALEEKLRSSPTPGWDEEETQLQAEWAWETLSKMGGRPTRAILYDTTRETKVADGYIYFRDEDGLEHSINEHNYNCLHWTLERERFNQELNDWKDFRKDQQRVRERQQTDGVTKNGEPQHRERRPHTFTLEDQKASELARDRYEQELKDWKESRDAQRLANHSQQGKGAEKEVNLQQQEHERELRLTASLTMLKDWRQFRTYRERRFVDYHRRRIKGCEGQLRALQREMDNATTDKTRENLSHRREKIRSEIFCQQLDLGRKEILLKRVKQQLPAILSECIDSTSGLPTSRRRLEEACELEARQLYNTLIEMGGKPSRSIRPPSNAWNPERTDDLLHILHYWDNEYLQFEEELDLWKKFRNWQRQPRESQQENGMKGNAEPEQLEQCPSESLAKLNDWKYFQTFQQWRVNLAKERVDAWERELEIGRQEARKTFKVFRQEKVDDANSSIDFCQRDLKSAQARGKADDGWFYRHPRTYEDEIEFLQERLNNAHKKLKEVGNNNTHLEFKRYKEKCDSSVKDAQDNIKHVQEQLHIEESRFKWITQQVPAIHSECTTVHSAGEALLPNHLENARMVQLNQNLLDDAKPTAQRYQQRSGNKKSRPVSHAVLGPAHSSRISKSKKREPAPLHQQPSIAKGGAGRKQINKTETMLLSAVDVVPRRSKRIAQVREKLDTLESGFILDSKINVASPPTDITPCRSENLSKNKGSSRTISRPMVRPDPQRRITRSESNGQGTNGNPKLTSTTGSHRITKKRDRKATQSWKPVMGRLIS
ncbi:hypothetical protein MMC14_009036 [Varicellaria rhodocarpa]|nr:hypothetical protein [Varicellaria rhodocarpa]